MFYSAEISQIVSSAVIAVFVGLLVAAALNDLCVYRIPNWLVIAIVALYPVFVISTELQIDWLLALAGAAGAFAIGFALFSFGVMGGGDVKLISATALWAGPTHLIEFLFVTAIIGGLMSIIMVTPARLALASAFDTIGLHRPREILLANVLPYGVAIAFGGVVVGLRQMMA
jgi:prepilin peptidase CpaA